MRGDLTTTISIVKSTCGVHHALRISTTALLRRLVRCCFLMLFVSGCASYGVVENSAMTDQSSERQYSITSYSQNRGDDEISLLLTFSGGETGAAAMACGVMEELHDTNVMLKKGSTRLQDEVDSISSVSGGSFTAVYYGSHGDRMLDTFEEVFLRNNPDFQRLLADFTKP